MRYTSRFVLPPSVALLLCCVWTVPVGAAEKGSSYHAALESIKADELAGQVGQLADPAMEGRESGTRGGIAAGDYLAGQYTRLHLRGGGDNAGFFQPFAPNFRNVLAIVQGNDPKLRDQVIVVCAHYDHIGYGGRGLSLDAYGSVHPGADDNASGTAAVLELAKACALLSPPPKRSVLFAHWDAEEKGLLGSKYWVANPTVPLNRVAAALDMDMIGRLRDKHLVVFGSRTACGWRRLVCGQNEDAGLRLEFSWTLKPNGDHYSFFEHEIPVLLFHTGLHQDYHRASDVAKLINSRGMMEITRMLFGVVCELANRPATPVFRAAARHETPETETEENLVAEIIKPADRLGVGWIEDAAVTGGVLVSSVTLGSPAERAGLHVGDRIVRVADRKILTDDDFFGAVSEAVSPASLTVKRHGENKPLTLTATLVGSPLRWGMTWRVDDAEPSVIILTHVVRGSPAARADLAAGDRIYQVGGRDFTDEAVFARLTKTFSDSMPLLIERDGRLRATILHVRLVEPLKRAA